MKHLAPKVASFFPIMLGEALDVYTKRALILKEGQRTMIAACLVQASRELQIERQAKKTAWIAAAPLKILSWRAVCLRDLRKI
jgi:hypothetical protein